MICEFWYIFIENGVTGRMVYHRVWDVLFGSRSRNFVFSLLCTLKLKRPLKTIKKFPKT